ncbi:C6 zinc finger domain protein [Aspergillus nomiae NRRL 13137]|uniref:C6 zinc finger domain protein n=1 Tax=Aspergillus nomiae NRRL (strain ATCC 15546 / NRRL 13137 / CBS 260.88 / M93) TaxID=1509407 RepID=A0A0L1IZ72_ASPN3|nr:C6 zinc finger domain protein [Aspergillus nomiae NRRL 13137]KNG84819.1 C6 zinc finger domain protein [Aspergillus nomiae NRRL 13137]
MPSRRSHTKSHHGCTQCKQRRIKCDEARPSCGSCRRKQTVCSFVSQAPLPLNPLRQYPPQSNSPSPGLHSAAANPTIPLLELELLHHWHTTTAASLAHSPAIQVLFRITVPDVALSYPFLMHSLLAVSALHIGHKCPAERRRKYTEAAIRHNDLSLSLCTPLLSNVTPENCHALFAFSCLVVIFAYAAEHPPSSLDTLGVADVVKVFKLVRGAGSIVGQARPWIQQGEMRQLLNAGRNLRQPATTKYAHELYARLQETIAQHATHLMNDRKVGPVLSSSLENLRDVFRRCTTLEDPGALMAWPVLVDADYLDLLLQGEPTAFVILGHYGVALELLKDEWWLDGWGELLVNLALKHLGTAGEWKMARCLELVRADRAERTARDGSTGGL